MFFEEPATLGTIVDCSKKAEELAAPCRASLVLSMASWVAAARSKGAPPEQPAIDTQRAAETNEIGIHRRALTRIGNPSNERRCGAGDRRAIVVPARQRSDDVLQAT